MSSSEPSQRSQELFGYIFRIQSGHRSLIFRCKEIDRAIHLSCITNRCLREISRFKTYKLYNIYGHGAYVSPIKNKKDLHKLVRLNAKVCAKSGIKSEIRVEGHENAWLWVEGHDIIRLNSVANGVVHWDRDLLMYRIYKHENDFINLFGPQ